jgi:type I restriction enzyme S subunit
MSDWKEYRLGDIALSSDFVANGSFASLKENVKYLDYENYAILIRLYDFHNNWKGPFVYVDEGSFNFLKKSNVEPGDLIIANVGANAGESFLAPPLKKSMTLGPNSILIKGRNSKYLFYYFNSTYGKWQLDSIITGSAQPKFNKTDLRNLKVKLPSETKQGLIVEILTSLDDKIELNNKINQELENLAQTLFKRWFIDFEFPNENGNPYKSSGGEMVDSELGEIPKGWVLDSLDKIADFLNGLALQKFPAASDFDFLPVIKIRELRQKDTTNSDKASSAIPAKYIIHNGDVLFSWSGTLMVDFWTNGKGALNQHLFKVTSNQFPKWFYYLWTKHHLSEFIKIAESKATTMGHIQRQHLSDAKVVIPNEINNFSVIIEPFITKIINNRIESFELIQLRDSLLPKLISGELEVKQTIN